MYTKMYSATIHGLEAIPVRVEVDVSYGLPGFAIVGSPSNQIREAQDRVRTALHNLNYTIPPRKVTINLSPGDVPKSGTGFDLPIAAAILETMGILPPDRLKNVMVTGEISLDGKVRGVRGILAIVQKARETGCRACIVPKENIDEAKMVEGIALAGVDSLDTFIDIVKEESWRDGKWNVLSGESEYRSENGEDFADIRGQIPAKRAALLAASGFHNLLLLGSPGSGKTMLARRMTQLLPPLSKEEMLALTRIYSIVGMLPEDRPWITERPFRSPHHTISAQALAGGGRVPVPGEITLAHKGILFLDEFPEMNRASLEILRQPLEDKEIWISRVRGRYVFPADFLLVAAMNPCPCGYFPDRNRCSCTEWEVNRYLNRVSQPLLDRMDICAETKPPTYEEFRGGQKEDEWTTEHMRRMAEHARERQEERYRKENFHSNAAIPAEKIGKYCVTTEGAEAMLRHAFSRLGISGRACNRILRVARTSADLDGSEKIQESHMAEAIGFRGLDKKYWKV